jgi:hypothetical protein
VKETRITSAVEQAVQLKLKALDVIMAEIIEPLRSLGSPDKVIGKPYDQWTPQDLGWLKRIYGTAEPNALSNFIFRKEVEKVRRLEQEIR